MCRRAISIFLILLLTGCINDELCTGKGTSVIKISFFEYGSGSSTSVALDSLGVSGDPLEYPIYADTTVSQINLAVDPDSTSTQFVFINSERTDTLEVNYDVIPSLISVDCGPELLFSNLDTLYSTFDSLVIEQNLFDLEVETNLKIYY